MDRDFWLGLWEANQLGWHLRETNPLLARHWPRLGIPSDAGVFVPLCGKSLDMRYLESLGHPVVGVELSDAAVQAYFEEAGEEPARTDLPNLARYAGAHTTLYCGDYFDLTASDLPAVRAVYDRGALIALPPSLRARYVDHMLRILPADAQILLVAYEYDQTRADGPPHSVAANEVAALYGPRCRIVGLERTTSSVVSPRLAEAGIGSATETVYHIVKDR